jgi:S-DNA-T family DNA segregation ATPase FtsK/SpoIIIE
LPEKVEGSFWLTDEDGKNIVNIEANNGYWNMKSNEDVKLIHNQSYVKDVNLVFYSFYYLEINNEQRLIYVDDIRDETIQYYNVSNSCSLILGRGVNYNISYNIQFINDNYLTLNFSDMGWEIVKSQNALVYVNDFVVTESNVRLKYGDTLFIFGLRINVYYGILSINNPNGVLLVNGLENTAFNMYPSNNVDVVDSDSIKEVDLYRDEDYFFKTPRMRRFIETQTVDITPPPNGTREEMLALLVLGPMLTMALISGVTLYNSLSGVLDKTKTLQDVMPSLLTSGAMLASCLLWPTLTRKYQKSMEKKKEKERQKKYKIYLDRKKNELKEISDTQRNIICENMIDLKKCEQIVMSRTRNLWERRVDQKDFLTVNSGSPTQSQMFNGVQQ